MKLNSKFATLAAAGLITAATGFGVSTTFAQPGDGATSRPASRPGLERHPEIRRALFGLREARKALEKADHDFDGHRVAALAGVDAAIKECEEALQVDKK